jgi:hypothetical protein
MKAWIKEYRFQILWATGGWFLLGFIAGAVTTFDERNAHSYKYSTNGHGGLDTEVIDISHSGCIYRSISALSNPGYILGCELFRRRFEYEGIDQALGSKK